MLELWPWIVLGLLGAYHGLNPGMDWLFAVGLGLQERSRSAVTRALVPMAVGQELSVALVVVVLGGALATGPAVVVRAAGAGRSWPSASGSWSTPATPDGSGSGSAAASSRCGRSSCRAPTAAGLMLLPVLLGLPDEGVAGGTGAGGHERMASGAGEVPVWSGAAAVVVHSAAMLLVMGVAAVVVYEKVGLGVLRRAWVNLDVVWAATLVVAGFFTLFT